MPTDDLFHLTPLDKIIQARMFFTKDNPFLAFIALSMEVKELPPDEIMQTAAVDGKGTLYYSPAFFEKLTSEEAIGIVAHECLHVALLHMLRLGPRDPLLWNYAADFIVNHLIQQMGYHLPTGLLTPDVFAKIFPKEDLNKMTVEEIYEKLKKEVQKLTGALEKLLKDGQFDKHIFGNLTPEEQKKLKEFWEKKATDAATFAKMRGSLPAYLEKYFDFLEPTLDWRSILERFIIRQLPQDYTWKRPSKKSYGQPYYLPSVLKENLDIIVCIDTSGSVSQEEYAQFASELLGMVQAYPNAINLKIIPADADVKKVYDSFDEFAAEKKRIGFGGTDFRPALKLAEEEKTSTTVIIYLTDGDGFYPSEPPSLPVLWILSKRHIDIKSIPFGEITVLEEKS